MGPRFFLRKTIGGHGHRLRVGVGPVPKSFLFPIYANFRTYMLKSLTQPHYAVLSVRNKPALTAYRPFGHRHTQAWIIITCKAVVDVHG